MPIPLLLAGAAAVAGAVGLAGHKDAKETNERAERMCLEAQELYEDTKVSLNKSKDNMEKALLNLGKTKKNTLETSISQFIKCYQRIKEIDFKESTGLSELSKMEISSNDIIELINMSNIYDSSIKSGAAGAATGTIIALAANGALPIIASSLGTAGTVLAMGEVGMAASLAGSALSVGAALTPLASIAAPVVLFTGISASLKADENLEKARTMYSQATAASEKMKISQRLCEAVADKSDMFDTLLVELDGIFSECTDLLDGVTRKKMGVFKNKKVSFNKLTTEEKELLMVTGALAKAVKTVIDTPMLNEDGTLSFQSEQVYNDVKKELPRLRHDSEEVKYIDYGIKVKSYMDKKTKSDVNSNEDGINQKSVLKSVLVIIATIIIYNITYDEIGPLLLIPSIIVCSIPIFVVLGIRFLPESFSAIKAIVICGTLVILSTFTLRLSPEYITNIITIPCLSTNLVFGAILLFRLSIYYEDNLNGKSVLKSTFAIIVTIIMHNITDGFIGALLFIPEIIVCTISILVIYVVLGEKIIPKSLYDGDESFSVKSVIIICTIPITLSVFILMLSPKSIINITKIPCISTMLLFGGMLLIRLPEVLKNR